MALVLSRVLRIGFLILGVLAAAALSTASLRAQGVAGIVGYVDDSSGASIVGAKIRLVSEDTSLPYETITNGQGEFVFPELPIGAYQVQVDAAGFRRYEQRRIQLQVGERVSLNIQMEVGKASDSVTVTTEAPLVNTSSSDLSTVVDQQRIQDMPLNGRDPMQLMLLVAGVVATSGAAIDQGFGWGPVGVPKTFVSASGGRGNSTNFVLDGGDNNDYYTNIAQAFPNPDALAEFQFVTNNYSAEYGNAKGGLVNAVIRSGSNEFHGSGFEFLRNYDMNATNFFSPGQPDQLKRNQFGFTFGGPVLLPRYNGHDKTFFFASLQDTKLRQTPDTAFSFSPTQAERNGDFSGSGTTLIDPLTNAPFPGNQIPLNRISPVSVALMQYLPVPANGTDLIQFVTPVKTNEFQWVGKLDHAINDNERLSLSFLYTNQNNLPYLQPTDIFTATQGLSLVQPTANVNLTSSLRPNLINALHASYSRQDAAYRGVYNSSITLSALGVEQPNLVPGTLGSISVNDFFTANNSGFPERLVANHAQLRDDLSWIKGKHELKFGAEFIYLVAGDIGTNTSSGSFAFGANFTGSNLGDFFLGLPSSYSLASTFGDLYTQKSWSFYVQDKYRLSRKLTINLGLRYEPYLPAVEKRDRQFELFIPGRQSQRFPNAPLGVLFPGDPGIPAAGVNSNLLNFAPRVGLAFDPRGDGKMSIRAGYGIFYDKPPWIVPENLIASPFYDSLSITPPQSFANPFLGQPPFDPTYVGSSKFVFPEGSFVGSYSPPLGFKMAYAQQWNLSIERQLPASILVRVAYAGSKGTHIAVADEGNIPAYGPDATESNINQRRPYGPAIGQMGLISPEGNSSYNSLQMTFEKRWSGSFSILANYSWQKSLDYNSHVMANGNLLFDPYNNNRSWGPSEYDVPQRFVTSALWALPKFAHSSQLVRQSLGGWQLNGIISVQAGVPFTIYSGVDNSFTGIGNDHADQILPNADLPSGRSLAQKLNEWFNTAAFTTNAVGTFGNTGRNILWGPGLANVDASLLKYFQITERAKLQFRAEAFNLFNHANFGLPDGYVTDPIFGQILSAGPPRILQLALKLYW